MTDPITTLDPAALFHSVSDPSRLRLLRLLKQHEFNVQELVGITELTQPRVSRHLAVLREQGWLRQRREGTWNWYGTVGPGSFAFGRDLFEQLIATADSVPEAAADDLAMAKVLAERDRRDAGFYAGLASRWDRIRSEYEHPDIRLGTVAGLVAPGLRLLDIGTGTGAMLPVFAAAAGAVVALDHSGAMLERAQRLCAEVGLTGVTFCGGKVEALPFADGDFDACHCAMALHHVEHPASAVAEMARVVRPGGTVMVTAFCPHGETWMRDELAHRWLGFAREEMEEFMERAGLVPKGHIVRSHSPVGGATKVPVGRKTPHWPEVFLATAGKPEAMTTAGPARTT